MRALVLDFDGVISDSAPEAFRVALRTYLEMHPGNPVARMNESTLYRKFLEIMPLGNRAEDYAVALAALEEAVPLPDQSRYDAFYAKLDPAMLRAFHERFSCVRAEFARVRPEEWRGLLAPYAEFIEILSRRVGQAAVAFATAKDRVSVRSLLLH